MEGSLFILPWILGFFIFVAYPLVYSLFMSFHRVKITGKGIQTTYVGTQYYRNILFVDGGVLYNDLLPFLRQSLIMIPIIIFFSLMIAIMLNQKFWGRGLFRALFFLPVIFATGQVMNNFLSQGQGQLDMVAQFELTSAISNYLPTSWAKPIISIMNSFVLILWYSGVQILIFLAGRQTITASVYEAARIDGANPWETFWKITLPAMTPFILLNTIYTIVDLFTFPTNPIITKVNTTDYGSSSALAWIYFIIIFVVLGLIMLLFARVAGSRKQKA